MSLTIKQIVLELVKLKRQKDQHLKLLMILFIGMHYLSVKVMQLRQHHFVEVGLV